MNKMSNFNNYKDPSAVFDSFNGTEIQAYLKITTKYNEYGQTEKFELLKLGNVSAISGVTQYENIPNVYIGFSRPSSIATGGSVVVGNITFAVLEQGFIKALTDVFKRAGFKKTYLSFENTDGKPSFGYNDLKFINDFPMIDLVLLGVKENDPDKKVQLEIKGMKFASGSSGIGVTQLAISEQYQFIAKKLHSFKPVKGSNENEEGSSNQAEEEVFTF